MKILLLQHATYLPSFGGENKSNRMLLESLVSRGHECCAVVPLSGAKTNVSVVDLLRVRAIPSETSETAIRFALNGVEVHAAKLPAHLTAEAMKQIAAFMPDWILVSSEDFAHQLLKAAVSCSSRVIYLAHTVSFLPFGPASFWPSEVGRNLFNRVCAIVAVSSFVKEYIRQYGGREASVVPFPVFVAPSFPRYYSFNTGYILMINPCAVKGLSVFLEIARTLPLLPFAAVPTWGTTDADLAALRSIANINLITPSEEIDAIYSKARLLVVPSLLHEAFGLVVIEAMLRGIPVLASDIGGLREAKLGIDYVIPVLPIKKYRGSVDERMVPSAVIPPQNVSPWVETITAVLAERKVYEQLADKSRTAALCYAHRAGPEHFEQFLEQLSLSDSLRRQTDGRC